MTARCNSGSESPFLLDAIQRVFALNFGSEIVGWRDGALYPLAGGSRWRGESSARRRCDWRGEIGGRLWLGLHLQGKGPGPVGRR
jgi:hypothetical protein